MSRRAQQIKRRWDLFKSQSHHFTVTLCDKEYQCTYVTGLSFLASNFGLFLLVEDSGRDTSASSRPYLLGLEALLNCVSINFVMGGHDPSSVGGELDRPWCYCTDSSSEANSRNGHKLVSSSCSCHRSSATFMRLNFNRF